MGLAPTFLVCLGVETFHSLPPFGGRLGHFTQLGCRKKPSAFDIGVGAPPGTRQLAPCVRLRPLAVGRSRSAKAAQKIAQTCTDEMVFHPPFFKPDAGSGEV